MAKVDNTHQLMRKSNMPPRIQKNILTFHNDKQVELPADIPEGADGYLFETSNLVLVLNNTIDKNNIWCFDQHGNKLWEIEPGLSRKPFHEMTDDPGIASIDAHGGVVVRDQDNDYYAVDLKTGHLELLGGERRGPPDFGNIILRARRGDSIKGEPVITDEIELHCCRVCGLYFQNLYPWGKDGKNPSHNTCPCCGVEFGIGDALKRLVLSHRELWIKHHEGKWQNELKRPKGWSIDEQLNNIPGGYLKGGRRRAYKGCIP